jgi:hypothetical protein
MVVLTKVRLPNGIDLWGPDPKGRGVGSLVGI